MISGLGKAGSLLFKVSYFNLLLPLFSNLLSFLLVAITTMAKALTWEAYRRARAGTGPHILIYHSMRIASYSYNNFLHRNCVLMMTSHNIIIIVLPTAKYTYMLLYDKWITYHFRINKNINKLCS